MTLTIIAVYGLRNRTPNRALPSEKKKGGLVSVLGPKQSSILSWRLCRLGTGHTIIRGDCLNSGMFLCYVVGIYEIWADFIVAPQWPTEGQGEDAKSEQMARVGCRVPLPHLPPLGIAHLHGETVLSRHLPHHSVYCHSPPITEQLFTCGVVPTGVEKRKHPEWNHFRAVCTHTFPGTLEPSPVWASREPV